MSGPYLFYPPRRAEMLIQGAFLVVLLSAGLFSLWQASTASEGRPFFFYLLLMSLAAFLAPLLIYRMRALQKAAYIIERDGLRLQWGLRIEEIPMDQVIWLGRAEELEQPIPLPWTRWPGSVLGRRRFPDGTPLEFFASRASSLVLVATSEGAYAISPENTDEFLQAYQRLSELGSLSPIDAQSIHPSFFLGRFWADLPSRYLLLGGAALSLLLWIWVSLAAPGQTGSTALEGIAPVQLFLLPFLNTTFFAADSLLALFFYRRSENYRQPGALDKPLAYLLLAAGAITPALFLGAAAYLS